MYQLLKFLVRVSLAVYFRRIKIVGRKKIKKKGPYIIIANHPSAFTDPIAIAVHIKPTMYFLAAGEYMGKGLKYRFMKKYLNMIPIYRPDTTPDDTDKNAGIFDKCIEHLQTGRSIMVFPEGKSSPEKQITPLKTGVARIVRATEIASELKAGVQIIPVGLNYSDPHKFRSDLYMNVGEPINAADYFTTDPAKEKEEVLALTDAMEKALINSVLHIDSEEHVDLLSKVNETYMRDLKSELGVEFTDQQKEFELNKLTLEAFSFFQKESPKAYDQMKAEIDDYFNQLSEHGFKDRELRKVDNRMGIEQYLFFVLSAPFYVLGLVTNFIPYQLTTFVQSRINVKDTFRGSIILAIGMVIYLMWYAAGVVAVWICTPLTYLSLLLPVVCYWAGIFALIYRKTAKYHIKRNKLRKYLKNHGSLKDDLLKKRQALINKFQSFRAIFDSQKV